MPLFQAKPVLVTAYVIHRVAERKPEGLPLYFKTKIPNQEMLLATPEMLARYTPSPGDYIVIQEDGYTYLNPKEVFERKYEPVELFTPDRRPTDPQR